MLQGQVHWSLSSLPILGLWSYHSPESSLLGSQPDAAVEGLAGIRGSRSLLMGERATQPRPQQ